MKRRATLSARRRPRIEVRGDAGANRGRLPRGSSTRGPAHLSGASPGCRV